jgi:ABC-type multidrug transport system ATPase subunit
MSVLTARGLRKSYGRLEVVCGVDLAVARGECYGLLGPNGAG